MKNISKKRFTEELISINSYKKYEKKQVELYDPFKEIDKRLNYDLVDEEQHIGFEDELDILEEGFNTYDETVVEFSNKRINQKYYQLCNRYKDIMNREEIFGFCLDIISEEFLHKLEKDFILIAEEKTLKNGKLGYHDDITTINVMLDTRINRHIDKWRGTYKQVQNGEVTFNSVPFVDSIDRELNTNSTDDNIDTPKTLGDNITDDSNIFSRALSEFTPEEVDKRLHKIYERADLTDREIEVLQTLERTPDNKFGAVYDRTVASEMLDCTSQNVSKIFNKAKRKIMKVYKRETRYNKLEEIQDFLNMADDEKIIIDFILDNLEEEYINYILYDSKLDGQLVRYFNRNNQDESAYYTDTMRKFCIYFLKEMYKYKEMTEQNIRLQELPKEEPKKVEKWEYTNIDTNIYTYVVESKLEDHEKKGKFIVIDNQKYYFIDKKEQLEKKTKQNYQKTTFLK